MTSWMMPLVIRKQLKEKILDKLRKQETAKDSEVSDMPAPPAKRRNYGYTGCTSFREWHPCPCELRTQLRCNIRYIHYMYIMCISTCPFIVLQSQDKNSSGDETANVNFYAVRPKATRIRWNNAKLECGPMPNVMVALPNTGGALCSTPQSLADAHYSSAVQ